MGELIARHSGALDGKWDAALEAAVGNLNAMDDGSAEWRGHLSLATHGENVAVEADGNPLMADPREGDQNPDLCGRLDDVDGRLPAGS